ncbi:hypothetical protein [Nocardia brasiliensis]|uniref:hypothetical protein n=1 Tax=Nocardia brasiliensis TaxID=37326 RepID=UPI00245798F9|nr:hypothetical protein [Nocardia brasiliensis]
MRTPELRVLNEVGVQTVVAVDLNEDYQGTVAAVVRNSGWWPGAPLDEHHRFGVLIIGYGSCSGCDAWESLHGEAKGKLEHCASLLETARWFESLAELKTFVAGTPGSYDASDHALQWYGHDTHFPEFQRKVAALQPGDEISEPQE